MTDLNKKLEELGVSKNVRDMLNSGRSRKDSDEEYVINLCDEVLGLTARRQYCFDFLKGDTGRKLPVDAYYEDLKLVELSYEKSVIYWK